MKKLTAKEYYASEQDYYLDNNNVADCKFQHTIDAETTLYAISENEDQFFIATVGNDDVFYVGITPAEFLSRKKAAAALGSIKSDKKAASSRENGKKGGRPKKFHSEQHDDELFNRVCINALNGIDVKSLSKTDFLTHQKWVEDNWDDLNAE